MNKLELLLKSIILFMSEYKENGNIESVKLVEDVIEETNNNEKYAKVYNDEDETISRLRQLLISIIKNEIVPDESIMMSLEVILSEKPAFLKIIDKYVFKKKITATITIIKNELKKELDKIKSVKLLKIALAKCRLKSTDPELVLANLKEEIDNIFTNNKRTKLPGLIDEVDFDNIESVKEAAKKAKDLVTSNMVFKLGWSCLSEMTQGGLRLGEFVTISALKHHYKSSLLKSIFLQIVRLNKPFKRCENKKPMIVFISLEEEIDNIMFFMYSYLKYVIEGIEFKPKDRDKITIDEMAEYLKKEITKNGFNFRLYRFNPDSFNIYNLKNLILKLENEGYDIQAAILDYVKKMSREGCRKDGPSGTDLLDLFSKIRNFFSERKTLFITPHQLSSDANKLLRVGLPPMEYMEKIVDKNYYADSTQLGQEIDLELFLLRTVVNRKTYLYIGRGKHRIPTVIPDELKYAILEFTSKISPIPEDNEEFSPCVKNNINDADDEFTF